MATVLVVDDRPVNRNLIVTLLGYRGHTVHEACDGAEALLVAQARHIDLVITDLVMPVMDGYELVRELRADPRLATMRVIFYTANYLRDEVRPVAAALGVRHIVSKPAEPESLLVAVDEALAGPAPVLDPAQPRDAHKEHLRALSAKLADKVRELQAVEESLKLSEARFRSLTESSPIGIFSLDRASQVTYSNPRLQEICGVSGRPADVPAWTELLHDDDRDRVLAAVAAATETATPYRDRVRIVRPAGGQRWADVQAAPVLDDSSQLTYVGTVEDVTEAVEAQRQRAEFQERLRTSERLESLGQLAAGVAHDFNNLLGAMLSYSDFVSVCIDELAASSSDPRLTQMHDDITAIRAAVDSASDLTHQLLMFGRQEIIHPAILDVNEIVRDAERLLARTIGEHIHLRSKLAPGLRPVNADRGHLEQVIVNLAVNARDAIAETGTVLITTDNVDMDEQTAELHPSATPGHYTRVTVTDDGAGMTPETVSRAFEPFFTTKPKGKGTGLGLATVHGIVAQFDGFVGIYSEPGFGTSIRVYLPSAVGTPELATPSAELAPAGHGESVLVVEDNDRLRAVTVRILAQNGYSVVHACGGEAAFTMLADMTTAIDLVLADVVMPDVSGREVAERAAYLRPGVPVLFMSGYAAGLIGPGARVDESVDLIEKPFTRSALLCRVAEALRCGSGSESL
jgi:PAS domain S-box-containing protein